MPNMDHDQQINVINCVAIESTLLTSNIYSIKRVIYLLVSECPRMANYPPAGQRIEGLFQNEHARNVTE